MERISEQNIRQEKVERLLKKIDTELKDKMDYYKHWSKECDDNMFNYFSAYYHYLTYLKYYIQKSDVFMSTDFVDRSVDIVSYKIPIRLIDIFLLDDFNFVNQFISVIGGLMNDGEEGEDAPIPIDICGLLNENFFSHSFISICDELLYEKRLEENNDKLG